MQPASLPNMFCDTFFAPMHLAFHEIEYEKLAIIRSYNIPRLKVTIPIPRLKVVHQIEYLKSVEGRTPLCLSYTQVQCEDHLLTVLVAPGGPRIENSAVQIEDKNVKGFCLQMCRRNRSCNRSTMVVVCHCGQLAVEQRYCSSEGCIGWSYH